MGWVMSGDYISLLDFGSLCEHTVVGHSEDRDLRDRAITSFYTAGTLVYSRQIGVHITWIPASTWHLFSCG